MCLSVKNGIFGIKLINVWHNGTLKQRDYGIASSLRQTINHFVMNVRVTQNEQTFTEWETRKFHHFLNL